MKNKLIFCILSLSLATTAWSYSCEPKAPEQCSLDELPNLKKVGIDTDETLKIADAVSECQETRSSSCMPVEDIVGNEKFQLSADNLFDALNGSDLNLKEIDNFNCDTKGKEGLFGKEESKAFYGTNNPLQSCLISKDLNKPDYDDKEDGKPLYSKCEPLYKSMRDQISKDKKFSIKCGNGVAERKFDMKLPDEAFYSSLKEMLALNTELDKESLKVISDKVDLFKKQLEAGDNVAIANFIQIQRGKQIIENKFEEYSKTKFPNLSDTELASRKANAIKLSLMESTITQVDSMYEDGLNVKSSATKVYEDSRIVGICNSSGAGYMLGDKTSSSNLRSDYATANKSIAVLNKDVKNEKKDQKYTPSVEEREDKLTAILDAASKPLREIDNSEKYQYGTIHQNKPLFDELHTRKVDSNYQKICPEPVLYESPRQKDLFKDNHYAFAEDNTEKMSAFDQELDKFTKTLKQKNAKGEPAIDMKRMILTSSASTFTNTKMKYDDGLCSTMNKNMTPATKESNGKLYTDVTKSHAKYCDGDKLKTEYANQSKQTGFALSYLELSMMRSLSLKDKVQSHFSKTEGLDPKFKDPNYVDSIVATNYRGSNFIECPGTADLIKNHPLYGQTAYGKKLESCAALANYNGTSGPLSPFALGDKNVTQEERDVYKEYKYVKISMDADIKPAPDVNLDQINYQGEAMSLSANYCAFGQTGAKPLKVSGGNHGGKQHSYTPKRRGKIMSLPCPEW